MSICVDHSTLQSSKSEAGGRDYITVRSDGKGLRVREKKGKNNCSERINNMKSTAFIGDGVVLCPIVVVTDRSQFLFSVVRKMLIVYNML